MPILLQLTYNDGTVEDKYIPAEIWRRSPKKVQKLIVTDKNKELKDISVDASWLTADIDVENNYYPRRIIPSRIEVYKSKKNKGKVNRDIMKDIKTEIKKDEDKKEKPLTEDKK